MKLQSQIILFFLFICGAMFAQEKGAITGKVLDAEMNNQTLPFANVFIKDTQIGNTTDFDGIYTISVDPGTYTVVFSFIGYTTVEVPNIVVKPGVSVTIEDVILSASEGEALDEVQVQVVTRKVSETALLAEQKNATEIKESIGSERLAKMGVSNAATATSKISGVTKNESSGDVYVRGLGDRYLSTTMNGLPIPSDDVENKNIDLNLFSTDVIENVAISKTYSSAGYADQASGNINVKSKQYSGKEIVLGLQGGFNSNVLKDGVFDNFKTSPNMDDASFGFYKKPIALIDAITGQTWNTQTRSTPLNYGIDISGGTKFDVFDRNLSLFATASHGASHTYNEGVFKAYRANVLDESYEDATFWRTNITTTGLIDLKYNVADGHSISYNTLFVNKLIDEVYEAGRDGKGYVFDQDPSEFGAFVRDQNLKQTRMFVNQLHGKHRISDYNTLEWAAGYNYVWAAEPNRIRNEVNTETEFVPPGFTPIDFEPGMTVQFAHVGDFQQRKSSQKIVDDEYNAYVKDQIILKRESDNPWKLNIGGNFRQKERDFESLSLGVRAKDVQTEDVDDLSKVFVKGNFDNGTIILRERDPDLYVGTLDVYAGYANLDFNWKKLSGNVGLRYEFDEIYVAWSVANYPGRNGDIKNDYNDLYPSLNLKYDLNDNSALRLSSSKTITLPEFKELAPFEYVSPTGRVTVGNPDLIASTNYNFDLKYEFYPSSSEIISLTGFFKDINDPITTALTRGSSGNFTFDNTGEKASVYGLEFETRWNLLEDSNEETILNLQLNATKMWFNQDLYEEFQYKNKTETDLQGASDFILNTALNYSNNKENEFGATASLNYSSDKIFALGAPEDFANSAELYNDEIIEKGFVTLDLVVRKQFTEKFSADLRALNIVNPTIQQTQKVRDIPTQVETNEVVQSYKKGSTITLGLTYSF